MAEHRKARDLGRRSPASGEARSQDAAGARGGPQEAQAGGMTKQPAQTSGRRPAKHEEKPEERKSFTRDEQDNPAMQGRGAPKPDTIAQRPEMQGIGRQSGDDEGRPATAEQEALEGEPHEGHTRWGRQRVRGDRNAPS